MPIALKSFYSSYERGEKQMGFKFYDTSASTSRIEVDLIQSAVMYSLKKFSVVIWIAI